MNIPLDDDLIKESQGSVTVTLESSSSDTLDYIIGLTNEISIPISDNEVYPTIIVPNIIVADVDSTVNFELEVVLSIKRRNYNCLCT